MGKQRFKKTIKLLLKLMLLLQIYCHLTTFTAEATQITVPKSCAECDEKGLTNRISKNEALDSVFDRPKRPVRLLPSKILR